MLFNSVFICWNDFGDGIRERNAVIQKDGDNFLKYIEKKENYISQPFHRIHRWYKFNEEGEGSKFPPAMIFAEGTRKNAFPLEKGSIEEIARGNVKSL